MSIKRNKRIIAITDPLSRSMIKRKENPNYYLVITSNGREHCYPATRLGKRIFAKTDIIKKRIMPKKKIEQKICYIRLFGNKHIYLP